MDQNNEEETNEIMSYLDCASAGLPKEVTSPEDDTPSPPQTDCIYLDYAATTPISPIATRAMIPYFTTYFGNPSSSHPYGNIPRNAVKHARKQVGQNLFGLPDGGKEENVIFTGCGTEANNLAIHLAVESTIAGWKKKHSSNNDNKPHVITSNVEHPAITECLKSLEARDIITVTYVPVQPLLGYVQASDVIAAIQPNRTCLVTIMYANNEIGSINPIREIAVECNSRNILFHTDAAQAVGKLCTSVQNIPEVDMMTVVGHKFGVPKGIAALYIKPNCLTVNNRVLPALFGSSGALLLGGGQEFGIRGGTENVPYIVAMGEMAAHVAQHRLDNVKGMEERRKALLDGLRNILGEDNVRPNGPSDPSKRLPNILSVGLRGVHGGMLLQSIQHKVACSAGSACHSGGAGISAVLKALDIPEEFALGTLRLSISADMDMEDVKKAVVIIGEAAKHQLVGK